MSVYLRLFTNTIPNLSGSIVMYELKGQDVTRKNLEKILKEKNLQAIFFHGHGGNTMIFGYGTNILIASGDNESMLENKIVHALSCDSAEILGKICIEKGTKSYMVSCMIGD